MGKEIFGHLTVGHIKQKLLRVGVKHPTILQPFFPVLFRAANAILHRYAGDHQVGLHFVIAAACQEEEFPGLFLRIIILASWLKP